MSRRIVTLCVVGLVCQLLLTGTALAASSQVRQLRPSPDCYVVFDVASLEVFSDNHTRLSVSDDRHVFDEPLYFRIEVDSARGTYRTLPWKPVEAEVDNSRDTGAVVAADPITHFWAKVTVYTEDPIGVDCARSAHRLDWSSDGVDVTYVSRSQTANPLSTTGWVVVFNRYTSLNYSPDHWSLTSSGDAKYENYPWQDDSLGTWAYHTMSVTGKANTTFSWSATWDNYGEDSNLLDGRAAVTSGYY